jgi:hypothetical protein
VEVGGFILSTLLEMRMCLDLKDAGGCPELIGTQVENDSPNASGSQDQNLDNYHFQSSGTVHVNGTNGLEFFCHERNVMEGFLRTRIISPSSLERLLRSKTTAAQVNNPRRGGDSTYFL